MHRNKQQDQEYWELMLIEKSCKSRGLEVKENEFLH